MWGEVRIGGKGRGENGSMEGCCELDWVLQGGADKKGSRGDRDDKFFKIMQKSWEEARAQARVVRQ